MERVRAVVAEGADIVDIGGVKAGPGEVVDVAEEIRRTVPFVAAVRAEFPDLVISVDTWRADVGREVCRAGADLLNDAWGGFDPALAEVAAEHDAALVCTHTNGATPRTPPHRPSYDDVVAAAIRDTVALAERAVSLGVRPRQPADRPGARLRQEHLALARADPASRRDGRDRLAGAGVAVPQGLRGGDPRRGRSTSAWSAPWPPPPSAPGTARGSTACTTSRRPGRCSTWSPASAAPVPRRGSSAGSPEPRRPPRYCRPVISTAVLLPHPPLLLRELGGAARTRSPTCARPPSTPSAPRWPARPRWWSSAATTRTGTGPADCRRRRPSLRYDGRATRPGPRCRVAGVGRRLLDDAGWDGPVELVAASRGTPDRGPVGGPGRAASRDRPDGTVLLVLGDGSARRGDEGPGVPRRPGVRVRRRGRGRPGGGRRRRPARTSTPASPRS